MHRPARRPYRVRWACSCLAAREGLRERLNAFPPVPPRAHARGRVQVVPLHWRGQDRMDNQILIAINLTLNMIQAVVLAWIAARYHVSPPKI